MPAPAAVAVAAPACIVGGMGKRKLNNRTREDVNNVLLAARSSRPRARRGTTAAASNPDDASPAVLSKLAAGVARQGVIENTHSTDVE